MFLRSYELILIGGNGSLTSYAVSSVYGYQIQHTFNFIQILGASLLSSITSCSDPPYIITSSNLQNKLVSCNINFKISLISFITITHITVKKLKIKLKQSKLFVECDY